MKRLDNFLKFQDLRKEFQFFSYDDYHYNFAGNALEISYNFNLSGKYFFNPRINIPYKDNILRPYDSLSAEALDNLVFHAGMIELVSYWKAACPQQVIIKPHKLSGAQVKFWKKIYYQGLGEFFYLNSIKVDEDSFMDLTGRGGKQINMIRDISPGGSLVPVGGGKDSAVSMGILNATGENWLPFVINPRNTSREVILAAGKSVHDTIDFFREIHPLLIKLNGEGFLNGHTPFSALLAFYSLLAAYLTGRTDIVLSNESSANEATVPGTTINHQYSKSFEFERDFRDYANMFISPGLNYFSLLRPLSELQIAKLFSAMPVFLHHFRSCNAGSKTDTWCGSCPKCLFTFIILSPFLKPETITGIFGKNLLDDPSLLDILEQLTGRQETKPFECIGTVSEVNIALNEAVRIYPAGELPYLIRVLRPPDESGGNSPDISGGYRKPKLNPDHFVPERYHNLLLNAIG